MSDERNKIIFILLDACRCDYISEADTPFLYQLGKRSRYFEKLKPSYGFCERTEIFVGLNSHDSGYYTAFGRDPAHSPYKKSTLILKILGYFEDKIKSALFSKILRRLIWEVAKYFPNTFYPARIPLADLSNYSLTEDGKVNALTQNRRSLYQRFSIFGGSMTSLDTYQALTDDERLSLALDNIDGPYDLYPIYIAELDAVGHKFGPNSQQLKSALKNVDQKLQEFWNQVNSDPKIGLVICGDHGMSSIKQRINVESEIKELKDRGQIDEKTAYFIDSTLVRFWFQGQENQKEIVRKMLSENFSAFGKIIDKCDYEFNDIPQSDKYGDLLFACDNGIVINPDFFTPSSVELKGMHGYVPIHEEHFGFCMITGLGIEAKKQEDVLPLTHVYTELNSLLKHTKTV